MKKITLALAIAGLASPAIAVDSTQAMTDYARAQMTEWVMVPEVITAIKAQNVETESLSSDQIIEMDTTWRAEIGQPSTPTIDSVLSNAVSEHLMNNVAYSEGRITEVFVMDARGLNVGHSAVTSDYWQGDEAKFTETYPVGPDAVHMSEIELDESTQTYQGQVSLSVVDPESGQVIGAVTFGLNAQAFF